MQHQLLFALDRHFLGMFWEFLLGIHLISPGCIPSWLVICWLRRPRHRLHSPRLRIRRLRCGPRGSRRPRGLRFRGARCLGRVESAALRGHLLQMILASTKRNVFINLVCVYVFNMYFRKTDMFLYSIFVSCLAIS